LVMRIVEMLPVTGAGVTLISEMTDPRHVAASDDTALRYEKLVTESGEGPCLAAYHTGSAVAIADLEIDDRFTSFRPRALEAGLVAVFAFPLRQGDKRLGALNLYRQTPGPLVDGDMEAAQMLADVTAAYLVNTQAREDLRSASERFYESSAHDALTGLANRSLLLERLGHALLRGRRSKKILAVVCAEIDNFSAIIDTHGQPTSDALLIEVGKRLTALLRDSDTLARIAGGEFVILCEDLDDKDQADGIGTRIADTLGMAFQSGGAEVTISARVGIVSASDGEYSPEQVLEDAQVAMHQARREGTGQERVVDLRERHWAEYRAGLQRDLQHAVARGELRAEYQPIVRTYDGRLVGMEAFLRWDHPSRGPIAPLLMVPLAEQAGLISGIGRFVLEQACTDRHRWAASNGGDHFGMAVNVSAHQLMSPDFVSTVAGVLASTDTPPGALTLEITESALIHDNDRALIVLDELKQLGVLLALDDFGTRNSSLAHLKRFPVDVVKINPAITATLTRDPATRGLVERVIELAHRLDIRVVVAGVETVEQLHEIAVLGGESCQGFYFARPMPADNLDLLTQHAPAGVDLHLPLATPA
jgi:diguanylate cyclase (GGDEF)-like protein